jgi:hypothetical protein
MPDLHGPKNDIDSEDSRSGYDPETPDSQAQPAVSPSQYRPDWWYVDRRVDLVRHRQSEQHCRTCLPLCRPSIVDPYTLHTRSCAHICKLLPMRCFRRTKTGKSGYHEEDDDRLGRSAGRDIHDERVERPQQVSGPKARGARVGIIGEWVLRRSWIPEEQERYAQGYDGEKELAEERLDQARRHDQG